MRKIKGTEKRIIKNTVMLYMMSFAKMLFPLLTLPYLTRVLSIDSYGTVSYVKAVMSYMQIIVDFGFLLSATRSIVEAGTNNRIIGEIIGETIQAKCILVFCGAGVTTLCCVFIPILSQNVAYTILSYIAVASSVLLPDFLFRGLEKMHIITIRFVIMRGISTALTFVFIHSNEDVLLIPVLDIIGTLIAVIWTWKEIKKMKIYIVFVSFRKSMYALKSSFIYFLSDAATTIFGAFNTVLIGIVLSNSDVAYWSVASQIVSAGCAMYSPITSGIYPHMVREKDMKLVKKVLMVCMPVIISGITVCMVISPWIMLVVGGKKYISAAGILRCLLPVLVISLPSMIYGWPCLGSIGKQKNVTFSTIISAIVQVGTIGIFALFNCLSLYSIAIARIISEVALLSIRFYFCKRYKALFT